MKNKTTEGLGNKNLMSFPEHDSLKYWRLKINVNVAQSYVNTICESIRVTILIIFRFVGRQRYPLLNSCHRSGNGHM
jgi:hypothetical protein